MNKNLIIIFIIIAVVAILGWIFLFQTEEKLAPLQTAKEFPSNSDITQPQTAVSKQEKAVYQHTSIPGISPYSEQTIEFGVSQKSDQLFENFEGIVSTITNHFTPQISEVNPSVQPPSSADLASIEQQVFDILYPDYFTNYLSDTQKFFIEEGFLNVSYQKIDNFNSEEKIFAFVNIIIDVFEEQGFHSKEDAEKFRNGVNQTWKNLLAEEKIYWKKKLIGSEFYKRNLNVLNNIQFDYKKITKTFNKIVKKMLPIAYADSVGDTPGSCWESGTAKPGGSNVSATCCDCGFVYGRRGRLIYVHHCGPDGSGCDVQTGCLNGVAGNNDKPAIWDPTTTICGVG